MRNSPPKGSPPWERVTRWAFEEAAMRRVTVQKPSRRTDTRRVREEADERPAERPEVRKDVARTWWPDG
jgi:hypothetical protein